MRGQGIKLKTTGSLTAALALLSFLLLLTTGCAASRTTVASPAFTISQNQKMIPVLPFANILVPDSFAESVFNDFIDNLNDSSDKTGYSFAIIKEDLHEVEKILPPAHIYLSGEVWSYLENSGCCSTEISVKSRLRIYRVLSRELLWEAELPLDTFFEHDRSTLAAEREKLAKRLAAELSAESVKALNSARRIQLD